LYPATFNHFLNVCRTASNNLKIFQEKGAFMSPREIMLEHIEFWTSSECPPMSQEDMELVKKIAEVLGVRVITRLHRERDVTEPICQAAGMN
jgi:hypothetical protein